MMLDQAERMYRDDPIFRGIVAHMEAAMHEMVYTPGELRAAAMLAAIRFESRRVRPIMIPLDNASKGGVIG